MTKLEEFKKFWHRNFDYVPLDVLSDKLILEYIKNAPTVEIAAGRAYDYVLAQGLANGLVEE